MGGQSAGAVRWSHGRVPGVPQAEAEAARPARRTEARIMIVVVVGGATALAAQLREDDSGNFRLGGLPLDWE